MRFWILCSLMLCLPGLTQPVHADPQPASADKTAQKKALQQELEQQIEELSERIKAAPRETALYSRRGDAYFFLGEFKQAVADYDKMVELDPSIKTSHWRRGIACYYAKQYADAARQFEIYHSFDNVDRENGIWRFFSQFQAKGPEAAQKGLLKYEKDDREPFPDLYRLFEGKTTPEAILKAINAAEISDQEREKRLFYANLYIGLNESLHGRKAKARTYLQQAVDNQWGPRAGFGPNYMWHTGRLELQLISTPENQK